MFLLNQPSPEEIDVFIAAQQGATFSYSEVGHSRTGIAPRGYNVDHNRAKLGTGSNAYVSAIEALKEWKMFDFEWLKLCWPTTQIEEGQTVAVLVRHFGFWSLNASRIVYTVEESGGDVERFGFAYGTLSEHAESGEERFIVEWHRQMNQVWYDLYAFSRPNHVLARMGSPVARWMQRQFARDSLEMMVRAVSQAAANRDLNPTASQLAL